jgi:serine/threonine protein kinase
MRNISEGITSSGKSVVADGLFTAAHTVDGLAVKVKMFHATHAARAMQEYQIMGKLYQAAPRHFVRPYAFLDGAHGQILPYSPKDKDHCVAAMCLVMEKGTTDMREYLVNYHFDRIEGLAISSNFLDILALASQCNIVLNDFKPSNIVRVHDGLRYHLKAIDFDGSRERDKRWPQRQLLRIAHQRLRGRYSQGREGSALLFYSHGIKWMLWLLV